jgi:hypothetical protein
MQQAFHSNPGSWRATAANWACACLLGLAGGLSSAPALAQNASTSGQALERRVKAAFIYKFLGYTEFPANAFGDAAAPLVIGVANADEMAAELTRIAAGRSVNNRPIAVRALRDGETATPVHLWFVGGSDCARVGRTIKAMPRSPLVVTESDNGLSQDSVINFRIVDERVRFDVALDAAERNNVKLSSRLLTVANHVQKGTP